MLPSKKRKSWEVKIVFWNIPPQIWKMTFDKNNGKLCINLGDYEVKSKGKQAIKMDQV